MKLLLPKHVVDTLLLALHRAGHREIGGILMGEHVADEDFRVTEITVQPESGTVASFVRFVHHVVSPLKSFFQKHNHDYRRFNYLGEWHSHPLFAVEPSGPDCETMWDIVQDPDVGATFAVLLIVRLNRGLLECSGTIFLPNRRRYAANIVLED